MDTDSLINTLIRTDLKPFEKVLYIYCSISNESSAKKLAELFKVSEITIRRSLATLRKLKLISTKIDVSILIQKNINFDTTCINSDRSCIISDTECIKSDTNCINFDTNSEKGHIYINKDININNNINLDSINKIKRATGVSRHRQFYQENSFCKDQNSQICQLNQANENESFQLTPLVENQPQLPAVNDEPKKKSTRFVVPTVEEVQAYMLEYCKKTVKKYKELFLVDTEREATEFVDFYESKGWYIGKSKMKDWKRTAQRWVRKTAEDIKLRKKQPRELSAQEDYAYSTAVMLENTRQPDEVVIEETGETEAEYRARRRKEAEEWLEQKRRENGYYDRH